VVNYPQHIFGEVDHPKNMLLGAVRIVPYVKNYENKINLV
jgi:hypothetical protein